MVDKKVSIIVPAIYRPDLTEVCIDSIKRYTNEDFEIIFVQEGEDKEIKSLALNSGFSTIEMRNPNKSIAGTYPAYNKDLKYVQNKTPKGYSGALNTGLAQATGDYICFMNNDTVAVPGWMDKMLECFEEKENVGLVCPTFWGSGAKQSVDWGTEPKFDYVDNIFSIIGVCFVIPKKVLAEIGKWDESFGHGGEDFDIVKRVQDAGYDVYVARESFIYHYGGASTRELVDNDMEKAKANQMAKLEMFSKKHDMPMEDIMDKINFSNNI